MKLSAQGLQLIKQQEGFRSRTYLDVAGFPTIGYGHLLIHPDSFPDGIDEAQAGEILAADIRDAEQAVGRLVKVALTAGPVRRPGRFLFPNLGSGPPRTPRPCSNCSTAAATPKLPSSSSAGTRPAARSAQPSRHAARPNSPSGTLPPSPKRRPDHPLPAGIPRLVDYAPRHLHHFCCALGDRAAPSMVISRYVDGKLWHSTPLGCIAPCGLLPIPNDSR